MSTEALKPKASSAERRHLQASKMSLNPNEARKTPNDELLLSLKKRRRCLRWIQEQGSSFAREAPRRDPPAGGKNLFDLAHNYFNEILQKNRKDTVFFRMTLLCVNVERRVFNSQMVLYLGLPARKGSAGPLLKNSNYGLPASLNKLRIWWLHREEFYILVAINF